MSGSTPAKGSSALASPRMRIGHYELFDRFAVGAMAELYLGRARGEEGFEKPVAIKRILPRLAEDARFAQMLQTEARIHASLSHKNIVQIHDLGISSEGEYFIVLEYVDGRDLGALLESVAKNPKPTANKRLDDAVGLYIMSELAEGVHFAHELRGSDGKPWGLVHRDISPSNVLLSYAGEVKLSDFGVAKRNTDHSVVTSLKGELGYISPEQARGATTDRRSDIFSLGAIAFELFTGSPLRHLTNSPDDYLKAASGIVASPTRYRPDIPPSIERVLAGALAPDPRDRFADARLFVDACREALAVVPRPSRGESGELRELLSTLLPPGAKAPHKVPSKVISLMPSMWEDVTVPDGIPLPVLGAHPAVRPVVHSTQPPPIPLNLAGQPTPGLAPLAPRTPAGQNGLAPRPLTREFARPIAASMTARTAALGKRSSLRAVRKHHNGAWAGLIVVALLVSALTSIHFYVMPLPVAAVYFRPAFVIVTSEPRNADVYLDGKKALGVTPAVVEVRRDHEEHVVEVRKDGFGSASQRLRYDRQVDLKVSIPLAPAQDTQPPKQ
jgi:serine/threonine protein kinase